MYCVLEIEKRKELYFLSLIMESSNQTFTKMKHNHRIVGLPARVCLIDSDIASVVSPYSVLNVIEHIPVCLSA